MFITLEGIDGAGKTSAARLLHSRLLELGHKSEVTQEPGGTPLGVLISEQVKQHPYDWMTLALLFNAARRDHVEKKLRPLLYSGYTIICDRFIHSTLVYQGDRMEIKALLQMATSGLAPDLTFWIDVPVEIALERKGNLDTIEKSANFLTLQKRYHQIWQRSPENFKKIDGTRSLEMVVDQMLQYIPNPKSC